MRLHLFCAFVACCLADDSYSKKSQNKDRLVQAHAVFRHGDRAPVEEMSSDEARGHFFRGRGHLTDKGIRQSYQLGSALRSRLIDQGGLLDERMKPTEILFRSSPSERCLQSAAAVGSALFSSDSAHNSSSSSSNQIYVPVVTESRKNDFLCFPHSCGPIMGEMREMAGLSREYNSTFWGVMRAIMYREMKNATFFTNKERFDLIEPLLLEKPAGLAVPSWFTGAAEEEARQITYRWLSLASATGPFHNPQWISIRSGFLLHSILSSLSSASNNIIDGKPIEDPKFYAYSTHDLQLMSLLESLSLLPAAVGKGRFPPFTACFLIELWDRSGSPFVKLFYRGLSGGFVPLTSLFPPCSGRDDCPAQQLTSCCRQFTTETPICKDAAPTSLFTSKALPSLFLLISSLHFLYNY